jgi:predicted ATP-dependent serine protease
MVLVGGEAGVGKTALLRRFCRDMADSGDVMAPTRGQAAAAAIRMGLLPEPDKPDNPGA